MRMSDWSSDVCSSDLVQARLVAHGHAGVHRRLGAFGALLALAVLMLGSMVAVTGARLGHSPPGAPPPLVFLAVPLGDMLVFALLVGAALRFRRDRKSTRLNSSH